MASRDIGELLIRRLRTVDGGARDDRILRAISNSGYAPALPAVVPFLDDSREAVRVDALEAIRLMDSPEVDGVIASRLGGNAPPKIQLAAIDAVRVRKPTATLAQALGGAARSPDSHVRYGAVELAVAWLNRRPELRHTLERVARHDAEEKMRGLASSALRAR